MVFPLKKIEKLNLEYKAAAKTDGGALKVVWRKLGINTCLNNPILTNTYQYIPIHTSIFQYQYVPTTSIHTNTCWAYANSQYTGHFGMYWLNIRVNTYQNTCKYVPNTYQYHLCSPQTRVSKRFWIHTKTYQNIPKTYQNIPQNIPIRVRFDTSGGNVGVVLVCIMVCICMFPLANTSWYISIPVHDSTGGIGMYWHM